MIEKRNDSLRTQIVLMNKRQEKNKNKHIFAIWNIKTITGKEVELVEEMRRYKKKLIRSVK